MVVEQPHRRWRLEQHITARRCVGVQPESLSPSLLYHMYKHYIHTPVSYSHIVWPRLSVWWLRTGIWMDLNLEQLFPTSLPVDDRDKGHHAACFILADHFANECLSQTLRYPTEPQSLLFKYHLYQKGAEFLSSWIISMYIHFTNIYILCIYIIIHIYIYMYMHTEIMDQSF